MTGRPQWPPGSLGLPAWAPAVAALTLAVAAAGARAGEAQDAAAARVRVDGCASLASSPWPSSPAGRRALLARLEEAREACLDHPAFLAVLGAAWLEQGEPRQALIWLERSLMLDPAQLGALADHALALAALGEPAARDELAARWAGRADVPAALRARLAAVHLAAGGPTPGAGNGTAAWVSRREASVLLGYETNLDQSPKLDELTLTPPEGPIDLPLANPLRPRRGPALQLDASWQLAHRGDDNRVWLAGVQAGGRLSPDQPDTDWGHAQVALAILQPWGVWRGQLAASLTAVGGSLNEPYRLARIGAATERKILGCSSRVGFDIESRRQQQSRIADSDTVSVLASTLCPLPDAAPWAWGVALRANDDRPLDADRPGGRQRKITLGLRLIGPLPAGARFDATLRLGTAQDAEGYSPLLENNARRRQTQIGAAVELTRPLPALAAAETVVQVGLQHQASNLAIFRYSGISLYTGLRWQW